MQKLSHKDYRTFEQLVGLNQEALKRVVTSYLIKKYDKERVIIAKEYVCAKGDIPIALIAHLDTVFSKPATEIYYDTVKNVMWSPDGLGADDRAGVFAILQILRAGFRPHVIFTTDEEIGGVGASILSHQQCPFEDLRYIIQLDRRGANDCVFYDCDNHNFVHYVERFGFVENFGSFSDISFLCPAWKIAGVNLSVGYQNEHSQIETLHIGHLLSTISKVKNMLSEQEIPSFEYIPCQYSWKFVKNPTSNFWQTADETATCECCGKQFNTDDMCQILDKNGNLLNYCEDCLFDSKKVDWCMICGEPYIIDPEDPDIKICPNCFEEAMSYNDKRY